jgi:hypothetical protein
VSGRILTVQSLDPLGALGGRPLTVLGGLVGIVTAVFLTLAHPEQIANPALAVAALVTAAAACAALIVVSAPRCAPVRRGSTSVIVAIGAAAAMLSALATWGANTIVRDDWSSLVLGLLLLALSPYRPPRDILLLSFAAAALVAGITVLQLPYFSAGLPAPVVVTIAVLPILALAVGGAAFSSTVLAYLTRWRRNATSASAEHADSLQEGITRAVQQGRVLILNQEVVPLFTELVERGSVAPGDSERARTVAAAIRDLMVAETQRSWLDDALGEHGRPGNVGRPTGVDDKARLLERMDFEQRSALRAFVVALRERAGAAPDDIAVRVLSAAGQNEVLLTCSTRRQDNDRVLAPYVAVLRAVFRRVNVGYSPQHVTVRFNYDAE